MWGPTNQTLSPLRRLSRSLYPLGLWPRPFAFPSGAPVGVHVRDENLHVNYLLPHTRLPTGHSPYQFVALAPRFVD